MPKQTWLKAAAIVVLVLAAAFGAAACNRSKDGRDASGEITIEKPDVFENIAEQTFLYSDKTATSAEFQLPPVVDLYQYQNEHTPDDGDFRFWGWSKDGKVAYNNGETFAYIFNFVDDKYIWGKIWRKIDNDAFYQEVRDACVENGIEFVQAQYKALPIVHNNRTYNVSVKEEYSTNYDDSPLVERLSIAVETQGKRKIVHTAFAAQNENSPVYSNFPLGYFISPFENRALIVMGKRIIGPYVYTFFIGCDLDSGFYAASDVKFTVIAEPSELVLKQAHIFNNEEAGAQIAIRPSATVSDFRYISIGFNNNDGKLYADRTLYEVRRLEGGKTFAVIWQGLSIPQRGISYMDGEQRKYFYLYENGMDGSIGLFEFTP